MSDSTQQPAFSDGRALELAVSLLNTGQVLRSALNEMLSEYGLNDARFLVLHELAACGPNGCTQTQLAERLKLSESNVCTLVERMRQDGWLYRHRDRNDRRKRVLLLTEQARNTLDELQEKQARWLRLLFGALSDQELSELNRLLHLLAGAIETRRHTVALETERTRSRMVVGSEPPSFSETNYSTVRGEQKRSQEAGQQPLQPCTPKDEQPVPLKISKSGVRLILHMPHREQFFGTCNNCPASRTCSKSSAGPAASEPSEESR